MYGPTGTSYVGDGDFKKIKVKKSLYGLKQVRCVPSSLTSGLQCLKHLHQQIYGDEVSFRIEPVNLPEYENVAIAKLQIRTDEIEQCAPIALMELTHGEFPNVILDKSNILEEGLSGNGEPYSSIYLLLGVNHEKAPGKHFVASELKTCVLDMCTHVSYCFFCKSRQHLRSKCPSAPKCVHCGQRSHPKWKCRASEKTRSMYRLHMQERRYMNIQSTYDKELEQKKVLLKRQPVVAPQVSTETQQEKQPVQAAGTKVPNPQPIKETAIEAGEPEGFSPIAGKDDQPSDTDSMDTEPLENIYEKEPASFNEPAPLENMSTIEPEANDRSMSTTANWDEIPIHESQASRTGMSRTGTLPVHRTAPQLWIIRPEDFESNLVPTIDFNDL